MANNDPPAPPAATPAPTAAPAPAPAASPSPPTTGPAPGDVVSAPTPAPSAEPVAAPTLPDAAATTTPAPATSTPTPDGAPTTTPTAVSGAAPAPWARSLSPAAATATTAAAASSLAPASTLPRATPATPPAVPTYSAYPPPPGYVSLTAPPPPLRATSLPAMLRKLAYVVSLVLGGSAVLAGVWSTFLLPLLHATYSARCALVAPQRDRWRGIVERLREIRECGLFPERIEAATDDDKLERSVSGVSAAKDSNALALVPSRRSERSRDRADRDRGDRDLLAPSNPATPRSRSPGPGDVAVLSPRSATISTAPDGAEGAEGADDAPAAPPIPTLPLYADASPLSSALRDLAASMDATATTRTSLVSTLEGYTSGLHRELFIARGATASTPWGPTPGATSRVGGVGLGTLGANLAKAGGGGHETSPLGLPPPRSDEWDAVRREVRAIKGLLLNRRNFNLPAARAN